MQSEHSEELLRITADALEQEPSAYYRIYLDGFGETAILMAFLDLLVVVYFLSVVVQQMVRGLEFEPDLKLFLIFGLFLK